VRGILYPYIAAAGDAIDQNIGPRGRKLAGGLARAMMASDGYQAAGQSALLAAAFGSMFLPGNAGATDDMMRAASARKLYSLPEQPPRPFSADYPRGAKAEETGRLTHDIEGRPLAARHIVGRQNKDGADVPLGGESLDEIAVAATGAPFAVVPRSEINGADGRYLFSDKSRRIPLGLSRAIELTPQEAADTARHEIGHWVDETAGTLKLPVKAAESAYDAGATGQVRDLRKVAKTGFPHTPQRHGYRGDDIPAEINAEALRLYMDDPNAFKELYPTLAAEIRRKVNANPRINKIIQFNSISGLIGAGGLAALYGAQQPSAQEQ
jgi:hypothetical protein